MTDNPGGAGRDSEEGAGTAAKRVVAYAQDGIRDDDGNFVVALVEEGEPGYWPTFTLARIERMYR